MEYMQWSAVVTEFCQKQGLERPQDLLDNGLLNVGGMECVLEFDRAQVNQLTLRFAVGAVPIHHKAQICEALLMSNFAGGVAAGWVWSLHPEQGRAICSYHMMLADATSSDDLACALETAALGTQQMWQQIQAVFDAGLRHAV